MPIDMKIENWVSTIDGAAVHVSCADREALLKWQQQRRAAIAHLILIGIVALGLSARGNTFGWLPWLILAWLTLHSIIHQRWWYYLGRELNRWARRYE